MTINQYEKINRIISQLTQLNHKLSSSQILSIDKVKESNKHFSLCYTTQATPKKKKKENHVK